MEELDFKLMQKKDVRIGIRISSAEKARLDKFCQKKGILISDLIRSAVRKVIERAG